MRATLTAAVAAVLVLAGASPAQASAAVVQGRVAVEVAYGLATFDVDVVTSTSQDRGWLRATITAPSRCGPLVWRVARPGPVARVQGRMAASCVPRSGRWMWTVRDDRDGRVSRVRAVVYR